jgi:hypothetical protein
MVVVLSKSVSAVDDVGRRADPKQPRCPRLEARAISRRAGRAARTSRSTRHAPRRFESVRTASVTPLPPRGRRGAGRRLGNLMHARADRARTSIAGAAPRRAHGDGSAAATSATLTPSIPFAIGSRASGSPTKWKVRCVRLMSLPGASSAAGELVSIS